jgi:hypothetical protein
MPFDLFAGARPWSAVGWGSSVSGRGLRTGGLALLFNCFWPLNFLLLALLLLLLLLLMVLMLLLFLLLLPRRGVNGSWLGEQSQRGH